MLSYELKTENFSGPLDKLLELIEEKKLEVTRFSLAEITSDFLEYIKKLESVEPRIISDFISIAARLILIKSKSLLPEMELTKEEEQSIEDLEARLKIYKEFKSAGELIQQLWLNKRKSFSRELFCGFKEGSVFCPPQLLDINLLHQNLEELHNLLMVGRLEEEKKKIISFEHYIGLLSKRVKAGLSKFSDLSIGREKTEVVGLFLALLYLLNDRVVEIRQESRFSDILILSSDV